MEPRINIVSGITLAHNTRTKEQVAAILARAEAVGGVIVKHAQDVFWGGHGGYFTDPDGHFWEVAWAPMFQFAPDGSLLIGKEERIDYESRIYRVGEYGVRDGCEPACGRP